MIHVENLSVSFGNRSIFHNISFNIRTGEKVGLVGENGAGKTTVLRILNREILPDSGIVRGCDKGVRITYIPQSLSFSTATLSMDVLSFMMEGRDLVRIKHRLAELENIFEKCDGSESQEDMMRLVGEYTELQDAFKNRQGYRADDDILQLWAGLEIEIVDFDQTVGTLSGGQRTRLMLARMLFEDSDILLLDEPTNHIDESSVDWLIRYLSQSRQTILLISHQPAFLDRVVQKILFLEKQTGSMFSYHGNYSQFLLLRQQEEKTEGRTRKNLLREIERQEAFIRDARQIQSTQKKSRQKVVEKLEHVLSETLGVQKRGKEKKISFQFRAADPLQTQALRFEEVKMQYGKRVIFSDITFALGPTERLGVVGENGVGKTTLLRLVGRDLVPTKGNVHINKKAQVGWYKQEQEDLHPDLTVLAEAVSAAPHHNIRSIRAALAHFLFSAERVEQIVYTLSWGEKARLVLCKIMLAGPNVLLLDEPTNHLDTFARSSLITALSEYQGAMLVVSHDLDFFQQIGIPWAIQLPKGTLERTF
ncbi:MAG: hypothetical protein A3B74_01275 [Candidatus Kerfeldbacteria bacterium RIFCSPHIGHO2_02_FULL_42_14]|uniref:ABC transporter domain-containing protein n=1 Tax=Candidatus Kerfeldbacteria bacterium RIFCSPHIGHO2_02_FULL_42_14 TaxID=1798540 RepID=A0A1G2ANA5_9BACT|nr:MAG: hypothetical protein A3B74_01275 [Candidatus Kerfeldbacteria bacterium RIFCSPHIGHO2_02_FULL_42_14]OGY81135.1 MAG: hypothetical protein A3E60_04740 [Candidatus Kerfeldbacteria bacterium RIFCSPHIGHO2_12_FULL_42_13]OGY84215.1 MAG: hypothetical protein A3I91_05465 [Candidatus Kerfeldbacteria bacterium RIFCSPLOWO2_02_FULL_42_19]OGY87490.1 MAG: hypothetical protein A3G01_02455 [Candidatus Kerfeldbacteria bacterium RIFCSPLOWO2_12_FULL_43_9]